MFEVKVGDRIKHKDGTRGTVTSVCHYADHTMVEWKYCGEYRVSGLSAITVITNEELPRWRRHPVAQ